MLESLFDNLPQIIESSASLFGVFALITIVLAIVAIWFFWKAPSGQKERIFLYIIVSSFFVIVSTLGIGILTGSQAVIETVERNPSRVEPNLVKLSQDLTDTLETYIQSTGKTVTQESKVEILKNAVELYVSSAANASSDSESQQDLSSLPTYENEVLIGRIIGASRDGADNRVKLSFSISNKTGQTIYLATEEYTTSVTSDLGESCTYGRPGQIKVLRSPTNNPNDYTPIDATGILTLSWRTPSQRRTTCAMKGQELFFSQGFIRYNENGNERFTMGFQNIPIQE